MGWTEARGSRYVARYRDAGQVITVGGFPTKAAAAKPAAKKPGGARIGQPVRDGKFAGHGRAARLAVLRRREGRAQVARSME